MKFTVKKMVQRGEIEFTVEGVEQYGRNYTGHTSEAGDPRHSKNFHTFKYGCHTIPDPGNEKYPIFSDADTAEIRGEKLSTRLQTIKEWVDNCKKKDAAQCGTATIEIPPTIEELQAEIKRLQPKRNKKGQFQEK